MTTEQRLLAKIRKERSGCWLMNTIVAPLAIELHGYDRMKDPFDLPANTAPRKKRRNLRESDIQSACVAYARSKGYWARKFSSPSQRSVPDYLFGKKFGDGTAFVVEGGIVERSIKWAEEFKAPGKHSTEAQTEEQDKMVAAGWTVIRDTGTRGEADIDQFKWRIDQMERTYG